MSDTSKELGDGGVHGPAQASAPEVDAEIVDDGHGRAQAGASGVSGADRSAPGPNASAGAPPSFSLSPGLILFIAFVLLCVAAIAAWRWSERAPAPSEAPPAAAPVSPPVSPQPAAPQSDPPRASDPQKIANAPAAAAKEAAAAIDPSAAPSSARGLPPPPAPAAGANEALQQAAKDAARLASGEDDGDAIDLGPATEESAPPTEQSAPAPPPQEQAAVVDGKIANEILDLKSALLDARAQSERQAGEIAALSERLDQALRDRDRAESAEVADLRSRLDKIQSGSGSLPASRHAAASLALVALARAIDKGGPYEAELNVLAGLAPGQPAIESLRAGAAKGAPTLVSLRSDFPAAARAARAAARGAEARGAFAMFLARLETLISIRPARPMAGADAAAVISRAEDQLDKDRLAAAVAEIEALKSPASGAFSSWLAAARARLAAEAAVGDLNADLLADFVN